MERTLPEQIQGYGLGVMNARAAYFAKKTNVFNPFLKEGRAFGPHGQYLIVQIVLKIMIMHFQQN